MENCTIYSHKLEFDKVAQLVKEKLPKAKVDINAVGNQKSIIATIKGGFFSKTKTLRLNWRERETPSYKLDEVNCGLTQNLSGMVNFISNLPAQNKDVQGKFLHKVMSMNCEIPFIAEPAISKEFEAVLKQIVFELDGFVFAQPNSVFKKSTGDHFLDKNLNLIQDTAGNCEVNDIEINADAKYLDGSDIYNEDQLTRKARSESKLAEKDIKVNINLPCLPSSVETTLRAKNEIIDRIYALLIIAAKGEGISSEQLAKPIEDKGIKSFSPKEHDVLHNTELTDETKAYATWRYESLYTLMWAVGKYPSLKEPTELCDVQDIVSKILHPDRSDFEADCIVRTPDEILDELDAIYRTNWACVDARIKGQHVGGEMNPSIIYERHFALNWLTCYHNQDWDNVQTNT
ncbi:MAG: DUF4272 domain-containing protein [Saprospiraceae bacterium]